MKRRDYRRRTSTTFKKKYGDRIYTFSHEVNETPGYTSSVTVVRVKKKGVSPLRVGRIVHMFISEKETD